MVGFFFTVTRSMRGFSFKSSSLLRNAKLIDQTGSLLHYFNSCIDNAICLLFEIRTSSHREKTSKLKEFRGGHLEGRQLIF